MSHVLVDFPENGCGKVHQLKYWKILKNSQEEIEQDDDYDLRGIGTKPERRKRITVSEIYSDAHATSNDFWFDV